MTDKWPIVLPKDDGIRPAGKKDECFYCGQKIGQPHGRDCVTITKRVRVRCIIEYVIDVPHHWTKEDIEFHRNDNTWCASNAVDELKELEQKIGCLCPASRFEFVGVTDSKPHQEEEQA